MYLGIEYLGIEKFDWMCFDHRERTRRFAGKQRRETVSITRRRAPGANSRSRNTTLACGTLGA